MQKQDCYFLGKITRKHGLSGNVILKIDTDDPEFYNKLESIFVEINGLLVPFFIENQKWQSANSLNLILKNASESIINQIIGKNVYLPLETLPKLSGNKFYYHEVIGFQIIDESGKKFGKITSISDQTAQHIFILDLDGKELIIPIIKDWISEVCRAEKIIKMNLPEGLLEIFK